MAVNLALFTPCVGTLARPCLSDRVMKGTELSFQTLTLNGGLSETLTEEVLRAVASPVAAVADHRHDHLLVFLVVGKHFFEALT